MIRTSSEVMSGVHYINVLFNWTNTEKNTAVHVHNRNESKGYVMKKPRRLRQLLVTHSDENIAILTEYVLYCYL